MKCALTHATSRLLQVLLIGAVVFFGAVAIATAQTRPASTVVPRPCASVDLALDTERPLALTEEGQTLATLRGIFASINARPVIDPERAIIVDLGAFMAVHFVRGQVACFVMLTNSRGLRAIAFPLKA